MFRVLQGVGGGMILPVGQLMMAEAAGPKRMGRVMSIVAVPAMLAPILGPTLGGLILDNASWRWIFYVNVPIGVIAVIAALRVLPTVERERTDPLDFVGLALMATGLPLITYGLAEIGEHRRASAHPRCDPADPRRRCSWPPSSGTRCGSRNPLLNLRLYKRPTFATASIAMFFLGAALFGGMILLPLYWQNVRHDERARHRPADRAPGAGRGARDAARGQAHRPHRRRPLALFGVS